jgi:hypothetical protein
MKIHYLLLPLGLIIIAWFGIGMMKANSAPLPVGFPSPTAPGKIEVKEYPAYRAATYHYSGNLPDAANQAFSPLYQHISSNNISMTAPVENSLSLKYHAGERDKRRSNCFLSLS